jgi:alpha-beta hydrolase superfamily lysophospholipase
VETSRIEATSDLVFYGRHWAPIGDPTGTLVLVHGLGEHSGRYTHVGEFFSKAGFDVYAPDLRGHGTRTDRPLFIRTYSELAADVVTVVARRRFEPCYLLGHSMGGQLVLWLGQQKLVSVAAIIASAPWLTLAHPPGKWLRRLARILNYTLPNLKFPSGIKPEYASRDQAHLDSLERIDLMHHYIRVRMYFEADKAAAALWAVPRFPFPVLLACGGEDQVTSTDATRTFYEQLEAPRKDFLFYPGLRHELHNETERSQVLADYLKWITGVARESS